VKALGQVGQFKPEKQALEGVTYAHKIEKAEAAIDWTQTAQVLAQRVRAFDPFPGMTTRWGGEVIKVWQAHVQTPARIEDIQKEPGTLLAVREDGLQVACGEGVLCLTQLQNAGGKRLPVTEFVRSFKGQVGDVFQS
jgi:methionyl-tRNA formyltransferase